MIARILREKIEGRKVLILGYGIEGQSTYRFIRKNFPEIRPDIADRDAGVELRHSTDHGWETEQFHSGDSYLEKIRDYDVVFRSPGVIVPDDLLASDRPLVLSQAEVFLQAYSGQTIGITGTKGKSTTSSLIHHILQTAGKDALLVGNIGIPPFDQADRITTGTLIACELSSNQLESISLAPFIAVLLNLYPEHLDRYHSLEAYYSSKMNIFRLQADNSFSIFNSDIPEIDKMIPRVSRQRKVLKFSSLAPPPDGCYLNGDQIFLCQEGERSVFSRITEEHYLKGNHNRMNMMAAVLACRCAGIADDDIRAGLASFRGLQHRMEYVGNFRGIDFYNDSIATIPEATVEAVKALKEVDTLILGGYDRMLDYSGMAGYLAGTGIRNFIFMGAAGKRMFGEFLALDKEGKNLFLVEKLEEAFAIIPVYTLPGKICLLSPAAASYDMFRNFEERGNLFKKIAGSL